MPFYSIYLCGDNGHFIDREDIHAGTDRDAVAFALKLTHPYGIEVWEKRRHVQMVAPDEARLDIDKVTKFSLTPGPDGLHA